MKLKFDRLIRFEPGRYENVIVPDGEIWKISIYQEPGSYIYINGNTPSTETVHTGFVVAGVKIGKSEKGNSSVYGIAFKVVE